MSSNANVRRATIAELIALSFLSLYVELLIIRWMSADMRAFTVFRTFPLITCFVGLGVGFALRKDDVYRHFLAATMLFALAMAVGNLSGVCFWGFPSLSVFQWQNLVGLLADPGWAYLIAFALTVVLLLSGPFAMCVAIGGRLGVLFGRLPALPAYCYNVLGAIAGSVAFPILCYLGFPPWQLLLPAVVAICALQWRSNTRQTNLTNVGLVAVLIPIFLLMPEPHAVPLIQELLKTDVQRTTLWSPYQRLDLATFYDNAAVAMPSAAAGASAVGAANAGASTAPFLGLEVGANRAFYQYFFSNYALTSSAISGTALLENMKRDYPLAFVLNEAKSALIVGAGVGQNVSAAVAAGLTDIDAVEIDPVIIDIGKRFNPDYRHRHVRVICDDARHFFSQTKKKYDVIDFSSLDSHAVSGLGSSVRVDAYIYTVESIRTALGLLNQNGLIFCSFVEAAPWTKQHLRAAFQEAAGYPPLCLRGKMIGTIYILGDGVKSGTLASHPAIADYIKEEVSPASGRILTDDWPYIYVRPDVIDYPYLLVVAEIVGLSMFASRRFLFTNRDWLNWQMFFLGSAFMILELHAIAFLSLLYGSTWITSAIVINGILVMILAANATVIKLDKFFSDHDLLPYIALLLSILLDYLLPAEQMLALGVLGHGIATFVTLLPMGLASIVFANAFKRARNVPGALAFNLFGAVLGGLLEYLSCYLGIKNLMLLGLGLYVLSLLCWLRTTQSRGPVEALLNQEPA